MPNHKEALLILRQTLMDELVLLQSQTDPLELDQQSIGRVSRIDAIQQQELAKSNYRAAALQLKEVIAALSRIDEDEYGYCEECGEDIASARLAVKPEVRFCVSCQASHEQ